MSDNVKPKEVIYAQTRWRPQRPQDFPQHGTAHQEGEPSQPHPAQRRYKTLINVYSFRNRKTGAFSFPQYHFEAPEEMVKSINRFIIINIKDAVEKQHLDESELYHLGTFDDDLGIFQLSEQPKCIADFGPLCEQIKDSYNHERQAAKSN